MNNVIKVTQSSNLHKHMRIHSGEKPKGECDSSFAQHSNTGTRIPFSMWV